MRAVARRFASLKIYARLRARIKPHTPSSQAHAALHTGYSAVARMIRTSKTMVADASRHPHLMLQRARSIPQKVPQGTPAKTLAGLTQRPPGTRHHPLHNVKQSQTPRTAAATRDRHTPDRETVALQRTLYGEAPNEAKPRKGRTAVAPHGADSQRRGRACRRLRPSKKPSPDGGARRDRTDDLLNANQALSQLSYGPIFAKRR
jgi:hypothetical protein